MNVDRSPMWIGLADLLLCILSAMIVAVAPTKAKVDGLKPKAEFRITADWPVASIPTSTFGSSGRRRSLSFMGRARPGAYRSIATVLAFRHRRSRLPTFMAQSESNKEGATIRCIAPGHYDIGVNLYSDRELAKGATAIPVRVEFTGLNPQVTTLFAGNVALDQVGQTINVVSFDLTYDGQVKLTDPPLEPISHAYERAKP
jgi:hypothetical protein